MEETVKTLSDRLTRVEESLTEVTHQLSFLIEELASIRLKGNETTLEAGKPIYADKQEAARILQPFFERLGIADLDPISIEELHKSMENNGIRAEDNEFSRAIIKERE